MIRIATLIALGALALPAAAQDGPALKGQVAVAGEIVRIGDLVDNAGAVADVAIFRAPDLGQTGSVSAGRVIEAVRPHQIIGLDTRGLAEVAVTRLSRAITPKEVEARILHALAGQYGPTDAKNLAVTFDNAVRTLHVEPGVGAELRVTRLAFEPRSGRFEAAFELPGSVAARKLPLRYTGALTETFEAAVPVRALAQGEVLKAGDVTLVRRPKAEFAANVVTNAEQVAGLAARRALRAGQMLREADLQKPELVGRNETITITYEVPGILLTVRGQALEAGAQGDIINVLNVQTKRTVQATVSGPGRVSVPAGTLRPAANVVATRPSSPNTARLRTE